MKELAALAYRDTTAENREFWKNEMGNALREIQSCYDEKLDTMRGELDTMYNVKVLVWRHTRAPNVPRPILLTFLRNMVTTGYTFARFYCIATYTCSLVCFSFDW